MNQATYQAAVCGTEGRYGVVFADLPGCISAGATIGEAREAAHEALALHLDGMIEDHDPLPTATRRTLDEIARLFDEDRAAAEPWVALFDVTVDLAEAAETVPLNVKADLVQRIADLATVTSSSIDSRRFIEQAVEHEIERYRKSAA